MPPENKNTPPKKIMVLMPDGKVIEPSGKQIMVIMPDGRVMEPSTIMTIEDIRDKQKTVFRMFGGSPQMIMSAKEALMVDISEVLKEAFGTKIEVMGQYKTDILVYYAPNAFSGDKQRAITVANQVYADRLKQLEVERREHMAAITRLKTLYENEKGKSIQFATMANQFRLQTMSDNEKEQLVTRARSEALEMVDEAVKSVEAEKADLERTLEQLAQQLSDTITISQHSDEMENLKQEYGDVNKRAMLVRPAADLEDLSLEQQQEYSRRLPKLSDQQGNPRLFDLAEVLKLKEGEQGLCEGSHVLLRFQPGDEVKYFIGRLFFNDTKDYVCLGQGFEITSSVYKGKAQGEIPSDEEVLGILSKNPLHVQIYLEAVRNSSIQTVQFWLHELKSGQLLEIQSIDQVIGDLQESQMHIAHHRDFEQEQVEAECGAEDSILEQQSTVDEEMQAVKRLIVTPLASKYVPDEMEWRKKESLARDKFQKEIAQRELKKLRDKKRTEVQTIYETVSRLIFDEEMVGRSNVNLKKYPPQIMALREKIGERAGERIKHDAGLLKKLLEEIE
ncbi:MAG: hypothetical protein Q7U71_08045 [bacterium]|nr:hypothetical protein [bacterium]